MFEAIKKAIAHCVAIRQVEDELLTFDSMARRVRIIPSMRTSQPAELYLPKLEAWVREDGSRIAFGRSRLFLHVYPGWFGRARLRHAIWIWRETREEIAALRRDVRDGENGNG